jgi:hypothetical protein
MSQICCPNSLILTAWTQTFRKQNQVMGNEASTETSAHQIQGSELLTVLTQYKFPQKDQKSPRSSKLLKQGSCFTVSIHSGSDLKGEGFFVTNGEASTNSSEDNTSQPSPQPSPRENKRRNEQKESFAELSRYRFPQKQQTLDTYQFPAKAY